MKITARGANISNHTSMMHTLTKRVAAALVAACSLAPLLAHADDNTYDARSLAMGGTGVTTANARNAPFENPAMLAAKPHDTLALEIPVISARVQGGKQDIYTLLNNTVNDSSDLTTAAQNFSNAYAAYSSGTGTLASVQAAAGAIVTPLNNFNTSLQAIGDKPFLLSAFAGAMLDAPSASHGIALFIDEHATAGATFAYNSNDQTLISNLSASLTSCSTGTTSACTTANSSLGTNGTITNLQSQLLLRAVRIKEVGFSYAYQFDSMNSSHWVIGLTPKVQQIHTYDYAINAQQGSSNFSLSQGENSYSAFNMDLGIVKTYPQYDGNSFMFGLAAHDLISKSYTTVLGDRIDIKPRAAVGASYQTELTTIGMDVDVIANKPVINGYSLPSQYVRVGAEFDAWRWAQLRVGYRHDLKGNYPNLPSVGLGFAPFGVIHADLSAAYASKKEAAVSFEAGINF